MSEDMEQRFKAICLKLWGEEEGEDIYAWIHDNRPPYFHSRLVQAMVPIWEMDKLDLRTKILCIITLFTGLHLDEVEFFMKMAAHHGIPQEQVEEVLLLAGLEAGFPRAEKAIMIMTRVYGEHAARQAS